MVTSWLPWNELTAGVHGQASYRSTPLVSCSMVNTRTPNYYAIRNKYIQNGSQPGPWARRSCLIWISRRRDPVWQLWMKIDGRSLLLLLVPLCNVAAVPSLFHCWGEGDWEARTAQGTYLQGVLAWRGTAELRLRPESMLQTGCTGGAPRVGYFLGNEPPCTLRPHHPSYRYTLASSL